MALEAGHDVERAARIRGCLIGGAVGDALGAQVEFESLTEIRARFGPLGVTGFGRGWVERPAGQFTDDTQMTLFTLEGLLRACVRSAGKGASDPVGVVHHAYLRWLHTQGLPWSEAGAGFAQGRAGPDGWLVTERVLHARRAPGRTCLTALQTGRAGTLEQAINNSKGCGGVMRAAPAGLIASDPATAFELGCRTAAITHGHPSGWYSAGVLAAAVAELVRGAHLADALDSARRLLDGRSGAEETAAAFDAAVALARRGPPGPEQLERLGGGWVGEEALAISVCCALAAPDFATALLASVNHSGDSDSTGSITGNLLGAALGIDAVPKEWVEALEGLDVIETLAADAATVTEWSSADPGDPRLARYPGW